MSFQEKYLKYKNKYLMLKKLLGSGLESSTQEKEAANDEKYSYTQMAKDRIRMGKIVHDQNFVANPTSVSSLQKLYEYIDNGGDLFIRPDDPEESYHEMGYYDYEIKYPYINKHLIDIALQINDKNLCSKIILSNQFKTLKPHEIENFVKKCKVMDASMP